MLFSVLRFQSALGRSDRQRGIGRGVPKKVGLGRFGTGQKERHHPARNLAGCRGSFIQPRPEDIASVTADGDYDTRKCHDAIAERGAHAVIPPRKNARPWKTAPAGAVARNEALRASKYLGRALWRRWSCGPNWNTIAQRSSIMAADFVTGKQFRHRGRKARQRSTPSSLIPKFFPLPYRVWMADIQRANFKPVA
jgi:hypothetical protein